MSDDEDVYETGLLPSPGRMLHEARIARKIGVEQVADVLRLHVRIIEALEADDAANLPAPAFVRGYLRAYAKMMEVPADRVIDAYNQLNGDEQPDITVRKGVRTQASSLDPRMRLATYAIVTVLVVLLALWWFTERDAAVTSSPATVAEIPRPASSMPVTSADDEDVRGEKAPLPSSGMADGGDRQDLERHETPAAGETTATVVDDALSESQDPGTARTVEEMTVTGTEADRATTDTMEVADVSGRETDAAGADTVPAGPEGSRLRLVLKGDSWVEIHDAEGKRLIYDLLRGGKTVEVHGREPFRVFLGNAVGVEVYLNGKRFDHSAYNRGNLARFELGQP